MVGTDLPSTIIKIYLMAEEKFPEKRISSQLGNNDCKNPGKILYTTQLIKTKYFSQVVNAMHIDSLCYTNL